MRQFIKLADGDVKFLPDVNYEVRGIFSEGGLSELFPTKLGNAAQRNVLERYLPVAWSYSRMRYFWKS